MLTFVRSTRVLAAGITVLAALVAYQLTLRYLGGDKLLIPAIVVALGAVGLILRPHPAVYGLLVLTYLVEGRFAYSFGGIRTDAGELLAYGLIGAWVVHVATNRQIKTPSYAWPVGLLLVAIVSGAVVADANRVDRGLLQGQTKAYLLYLLVLPLAAFIATSKQKRQLEKWVVRIALAGAAYTLFQLALGEAVTRVSAFNTLGVLANAQRVKPPVLELMVVAGMLVLARALTEGFTPARVAQLGVFVVLWGFSFYRSAWFGLVIGSALLLRTAPGEHRGRRAFRAAIVMGLVTPLIGTLAASGALGPSAVEVTRRVASTVSPELSEESSYTDRETEAEHAVDALIDSPVFGVGIAGNYGAYVRLYDPRLNRHIYVARPWSHNSYLQLYLQLGLLGVVAMTALGRQVFHNVRQVLHAGAADDQVRAAAAGAAVVVFALKAAFNTQLLERPAIVGLLIALTLAHAPSAPE